MQNAVAKNLFHSSERNMLGKRGFQCLIVLMRILFGLGWLMAGVSKIVGEAGSTGHSWFAEPGVLLTDYLMKVLDKPNVSGFYKDFIENVALHQVTFLNYAIPIVQVIVGIFLIVGFMTLPSILICLFMHINFLLSGNINLLSITLYTSAFGLLLSGRHAYSFGLDRYFKQGNVFRLPYAKTKEVRKETLAQDELKKLLSDSLHEITMSVEKAQASQNERIEQFIAYLQERNSSNQVEQKHHAKSAARQL